MNAETKNQASNCHLFWVVFTVSTFVGNPVLSYYLKLLCWYCCASCTLFQSFLVITVFVKFVKFIYFCAGKLRTECTWGWPCLPWSSENVDSCCTYFDECTVFSVHCAPKIQWVYSIQCTVYSLHCAPKIRWVYSIQCTV